MDSYGTDSRSTFAAAPAFYRDILGPLAASFYALFTLLPDSSSLVVSWPWVFIWQVALLLPWLWLLRHTWIQRQIPTLGYGLDYGVGLAILGLVGSTLLAEFPQQARWYGWAALCGLTAFYALRAWCTSPERRLNLLKAQGGLSLAFIAISLSLWSWQTLRPELGRVADLRAAGLDIGFDFSVLELRNWAPIGHQNYVAGYLVLSLPLLLGLCLISKAKWKWVWGVGFGSGLIDLYTTSSRGGWLGALLIAISGGLLLLGHRRLPLKFRWVIGIALLVSVVGLGLANNRLRSLFFATTADSAGGETAFRLITNTTGWAIGLAHPLFGAGPGSVPLLYQKYRPAWAGRAAELVYQLHGTPAQIWAEFGGFGIALSIATMSFLVYWGIRLWRAQPPGLSSDRILSWSLLAGLAGYGVVSLTDYQLDMVCIGGTLIIYSVSLLSLLHQYVPSRAVARAAKPSQIAVLCWGMVGLLIAIGIWLAPIHRAWQLSSLGFTALSQKQIEPFQKYLEQAHQLAPWEPYYSYQLGWNLVTAKRDDERVDHERIERARFDQALKAFEQNVKASPNQESGTSSLGWAQLIERKPTLKAFLKSTQLMPAKRGVFHSLGLSLLWQKQNDLGIQAIALEIVRDPIWITSPIWRSDTFFGSASIAPQVQAAVIKIYQQLLKSSAQKETLTAYLHQCLGGVYWWQGNLTEAQREWSISGSYISQQVLNLAQGQSALVSKPKEIPSLASEGILKAWLDPQSRQKEIATALLHATQAQPDPKQVQAILVGMNQSKSFEQWVKQNAPIRQSPRERAGFGVLSRHIDGPAPQDFFPVVENTAMSLFLAELLPSPDYSPALDNALEPLRNELWRSVEPAQPKP
jgi:uncharacterized protein involved in response to NO